jgi:hypothetical protein
LVQAAVAARLAEPEAASRAQLPVSSPVQPQAMYRRALPHPATVSR